MNAAAVFDRVAARYDELWTWTPVGRAQRNLVWRDVDPLFRAGDSILDIGCGTGEDAAHFAARGVIVHATDPSPAMIRAAETRGGFTTEVLRAEDLPWRAHSCAPRRRMEYDGAISNFGALNCVEDLPAVVSGLAALVRPGGHIAICIIGRVCAWETLYYATRFQFKNAFRRLNGSAPSSLGITVRYPTSREFRALLASSFTCERWTGIGLFVPPSYVALPARLVAFLSALDSVLARLPLLRTIADHRLFIFKRKATC